MGTEHQYLNLRIEKGQENREVLSFLYQEMALSTRKIVCPESGITQGYEKNTAIYE